MGDGGSQRDAREWDLEGEPELLLQVLVDQARESTRRHRLPADLASDIAQEAFERLWETFRSKGERPTRAIALTLVERVTSAERQRRRRERARLARGVPSPVSRARPICARLSLLDPYAASPREYRAALHAAAVFAAHMSGVLRNDQLRLFGLVHAMGWDHDAILAQLKITTTRKALQKRIRRLRRRIETHVVALLEQEVATTDWERIAGLLLGPGSPRERIEKAPSSELRRLSGVVLRGLRRVIHNDPGPDPSS
jgi:hypothetical protein